MGLFALLAAALVLPLAPATSNLYISVFGVVAKFSIYGLWAAIDVFFPFLSCVFP